MPLAPYRRHRPACDHKDKGQHYSLCSCPIWIYGALPNGERTRQSLGTNDWARAQRRVELIERGEARAFLAEKGAGRSLSSAIEAYCADLKARDLKEGTLSINQHLFAHLTAYFGEDATLPGITLPMMDAFRNSRVRKLKRRPDAPDRAPHPK